MIFQPLTSIFRGQSTSTMPNKENEMVSAESKVSEQIEIEKEIESDPKPSTSFSALKTFIGKNRKASENSDAREAIFATRPSRRRYSCMVCYINDLIKH